MNSDPERLEAVEKEIWLASGWQADQEYVDRVLAAVERYAKNPSEPDRIVTAQPQPESAPPPPVDLRSFRAFTDAEGDVWVCIGGAGAPQADGKQECSACGERKDLAEFRTYARNREVRRPQCRSCENAGKRKAHALKKQATGGVM